MQLCPSGASKLSKISLSSELRGGILPASTSVLHPRSSLPGTIRQLSTSDLNTSDSQLLYANDERIALMSVAALDTPPRSDVEPAANLPPPPPLSPTKSARHSLSTVDRLIGTLRLQRRGRHDTSSDWRVVKLSEAEYEQFQQRLRQEPALLDWFEGKLRYDWDAQDGRLVLRMPSALHERFNASIEGAIDGAIADLVRRLEQSAEKGDGGSAVEDGKLAAELEKLYKGRSATIELKVPSKLVNPSGGSQESDSSLEQEESIVKRSPDASFYHPSQPDHPTLVVEVSYSQQQKDLPYLADSYIVDSAHAIRAVLCIKLPYLSPAAQANPRKRAHWDKTASYSLWRPAFYTADGKRSSLSNDEAIGGCEEDVRGACFRDASGKLVGGALTLRPEDLLPLDSEVLETSSPTSDLVLHIDHRQLCDALDDAEAAMHPSETKKEELKRLAERREALRPRRFRKRKRSPSEELSDGREEWFLLQEMRERGRTDKVDGGYIETARRVRRKVTLEDDGVEVVAGASTASHTGDDHAEASREVG